MENKDVNLIRHHINLMESLNKRISLNKSLMEEVIELEEQAVQAAKAAFQGLKGLGQQADDIARAAGRQLGTNFKNYDDFLQQLNSGRISPAQANTVWQNVIKTSPELMNTLKASMTRNKDFVKLAQQVYPKGITQGADLAKNAALTKMLKNMGYTDEAANDIIRKSAEFGGPINLGRTSPRIKVKGGTQKPPAATKVDDAAAAATKGDALDIALKNQRTRSLLLKDAAAAATKIDDVAAAEIKAAGEVAKTTAGGIKRVKLNKWLIATAVALSGAWFLLSNYGKDKVEIEDEDGNVVNPGGTLPRTPFPYLPDQPIPPPQSRTTYKNCTDFPYAFGCRSQIIKEVQVCLGMPLKYQTGNFGPITLGKLREKNLGDTITKEVYDSIIQACQGGTTNTTTSTTTGTTTKIDSRNLGNVMQTPKLTQVDTSRYNISTQPQSSIQPQSSTQPQSSQQLQLTRESCEALFSTIDDRDQSQGIATATNQEKEQLKFCLQQYNFGLGQGANKMKRRYGLTPSGGDKGIR